MSETQDQQQTSIDKAVAEGGAYEILRKRLTSLGQELNQKTEALNQERLSEFGKSDMSIISRIRIRTENNCVARDIVRFGDWLLFGYNVYLGLKKETKIEDVFSLYQLVERDNNYEADPVDLSNTFLNIDRFIQDFNELYTYYKNAQLLQLVERDGKLLASFQIGERISDIRVFRWSISSDKKTIEYIDNRGERDIALPPAYDFEWIETTREDIVNGRFPHINVLDTVFVETIGGDLTIKCENNTNDGLGIYREEVVDKNQSINDAKIEYAKVGSLILLKILPYREDNWRYLVYNSLTQQVHRIDFIGQSCIQLPEDHGIIFPGGYYLQNGDYKTFDQSMSGMRFRRIRRSPNGEDVLYIFYDPSNGRLALFNYNMIER
ncbi:DNA repair ATPase, partial [Gilliamella sp. B3023]